MRDKVSQVSYQDESANPATVASSWSKLTSQKTDMLSVPQRLLDRRPGQTGCDWWEPGARPSPAQHCGSDWWRNRVAPPLPPVGKGGYPGGCATAEGALEHRCYGLGEMEDRPGPKSSTPAMDCSP